MHCRVLQRTEGVCYRSHLDLLVYPLYGVWDTVRFKHQACQGGCLDTAEYLASLGRWSTRYPCQIAPDSTKEMLCGRRVQGIPEHFLSRP